MKVRGWIWMGLVAGALTSVPGAAQGQLALGGTLSVGTDSDFGVGGRLLFSLERLVSLMEGTVGVDVFFPDGLDWWEINANVGVPVRLADNFMPYLGGGLNVASISVDETDADDTEVGLNLVGGMRFPQSGFTPFVEVRATLAGADQLVLAGGVLFGWGR